MSGAVLWSEILDGEIEAVFGDEYILTHEATGRQFLVSGDASDAMRLCDEYLRSMGRPTPVAEPEEPVEQL